MANHTDNVGSDSWTEHELWVLKTLLALNFPMDIICNELDRSWTALALKATDLGLTYGLSRPDGHTVRLKTGQRNTKLTNILLSA